MVTVLHRASKARAPIALNCGAGRSLALLAVSWLALAAPAHAASEDEGFRGPDVTIIADEERTIYEFRQNGELRMVRVVPSFGKPYYLVPRDPTKGFGDLERADTLVPSWVILEF